MDRDDKVLLYVQERLTTGERDTFEREIAGDPTLAAEVTALQAARRALVPEVQAADGWDRLSNAIDATRPAAANDNRPIRFTLLQAAGLVVAAVALWQFIAVPTLGTGPADRYTVAGVDADAPRLQVLFQADASAGEIVTLLSELEGTIVSGPGALGIFRVEFADDAALEAARLRLTERSELVEQVMGN